MVVDTAHKTITATALSRAGINSTCCTDVIIRWMFEEDHDDEHTVQYISMGLLFTHFIVAMCKCSSVFLLDS